MANGEEVLVGMSSIPDGLARRARPDQAEQFIPALWAVQQRRIRIERMMIRAAAGYQDGAVEESSAGVSAPVGRNSADRFECIGRRIVELGNDPIFADWIKRSRNAGYENASAIDSRRHRVNKVK